ncbi:hypothetical protein TWF696_009696 [Orbilia brochopaga]|uniref:Uncharacterized protein n=1 Tax=Orbilia brochopaga TaxID=3140254 RepID=A0AAV9UED9_9PEZI
MADDDHKIDRDVAAELITAAEQPQTVRNYIPDLKSKIFFSENWDVMLAAAPVCLELLGSCIALSTTEFGVTTLTPPPNKGGKFTYLGYTDLKTCLVDVSNHGRNSFIVARDQMARIQKRSKYAVESTKRIFGALNASPPSLAVVKIEMETLTESAKESTEAAVKMHEAFQYWLLYVQELHVACQAAEGKYDADFKLVKNKEAAAKFNEELQKKRVEMADKMLKKYEKQMDDDHKIFKEKLENYPKGSDLLNDQLRLLAAETGANLVNTLGIAGACYISPQASFALGARELKDVDLKSTLGNTGNGDDKNQNIDKLEDDLTDMGLLSCPEVISILTDLKSILTSSPKDGVDWERVLGIAEDDGGAGIPNPKVPDPEKKDTTGDETGAGITPPVKKDEIGERDDEKFTKKKRDREVQPKEKKENGSINLDTVSLTLGNLYDSLTDDATKTGLILAKIVVDAQKVAKEVQEEGKKASNLNWKRPAKSSATVTGWTKTVETCLTKVTALQTKAKLRPGVQNGRPTVLFPPDPAAKEKVKNRTDLTKATVQAARDALEISRDAYHATQEFYNQAGDRVLEVQEKLDNLRIELKDLAQQKLDLSAVRDVLSNCIAYIIDLQDKIEVLIRFFTTVSILVETSMTKQVKPFQKYVNAASEEILQNGVYEAFLYDTIFQSVVGIAANYSVYEDIAIMYIRVHEEYLVEGNTLVLEMALHANSAGKEAKTIKEKQEQLSAYSKKASEGIKLIVKQTGETMTAGIPAQIAELDRLLKLAQDNGIAPLPETQKAIKETKKEVISKVKVQIGLKAPMIDYLCASKEERTRDTGKLAKAVTAGLPSHLDF